MFIECKGSLNKESYLRNFQSLLRIQTESQLLTMLELWKRFEKAPERELILIQSSIEKIAKALKKPSSSVQSYIYFLRKIGLIMCVGRSTYKLNESLFPTETPNTIEGKRQIIINYYDSDKIY